jgi:broad specificity phosphatase PhoE
MDTIEEFKEWLLDFVTRNDHESHDWLVERLERKLEAVAPAKPRIVVSAPLVLRVLRKKATASG